MTESGSKEPILIYQETMATEAFDSGYEDDDIEFRSLSKAAIASVLFALFSATGFLIAPMAILAIIGFGVGLIGFFAVMKYPEELAGKGVALVGITLSILMFAGAVGMHTYIYMTEVPEGKTRISFADLQPRSKTTGLRVSEKSLDIRGTDVFMKGYVYPGKKRENLDKFILVRDFGTCCFGGSPKPTHMVEIELKGGRRTQYNKRLRRIGGTFFVENQLKKVDEDDLPGIFYRIEADYLK